MKKITQEEFDEIIKKHQKWLDGEPDGECADLSYTDLREVDYKIKENAYCSNLNLSHANLKLANLSGCCLGFVNFTAANLTGADLSNTVLWQTNFRYAYCKGVKWDNADFRYAPVFSNATCTRIYQISLGMLNSHDSDLGGLNCNAMLTLYAPIGDWKYFVGDFRGSKDELLELIDKEQYCFSKNKLLRYAVESITKIAEMNHINCNSIDGETKVGIKHIRKFHEEMMENEQ